MRYEITMLAGLALLASPLAAANHTHGGANAEIVITHDVPDAGTTYVGNVNHFGYILFDKDGKPAFHHNARFEVEQNGVLLYATDSAHDYDGVNGIAVRFPVPGPYTVRAIVPKDTGEARAEFSGTVAAGGAPIARIALDAPASAMAGEPVGIALSVVDELGEPIPHADTIVEIRHVEDDAPVLRLHTHQHKDGQELSYSFERSGDYTIRVLAYVAFPEGSPLFAPVAVEQAISVSPGVAPPVAPTVPMAQERNAVTTGEAAPPFVIYATYDPYTTVGPFGPLRASVVVLDPETRMPAPHINFQARLVDPLGRVVFESASLHEYDGVFEILTTNRIAGPYLLSVDAMQGDWKGHVDASFVVTPPAEAIAAGPQVIDVAGTDGLAAGVPARIEFFAHDLAGAPFMHSEIDARILAAEGIPVTWGKLHTHADGKFAFDVTLPEEGEYMLAFDAFSLEASPTPIYYGPNMGPRLLTLSVGEGPGLPVPEPLVGAGAEVEEQARTPGVEGAIVALSLAGVALMVGRRRR